MTEDDHRLRELQEQYLNFLDDEVRVNIYSQILVLCQSVYFTKLCFFLLIP